VKAKYNGKCSICCGDIHAAVDDITRTGPKGYAHTRCTVVGALAPCNVCGVVLQLGYKERGLCDLCEKVQDALYATMKGHWTSEAVKQAIEVDNRFVARALRALFARQTADERAVDDTRHLNGLGFSAADAKRLSLSAKWVEKNGRLDGWYLGEVRRRLLKYGRQLAEIANERTAAEDVRARTLDLTGEKLSEPVVLKAWQVRAGDHINDPDGGYISTVLKVDVMQTMVEFTVQEGADPDVFTHCAPRLSEWNVRRSV
jgi:hypothetical protein